MKKRASKRGSTGKAVSRSSPVRKRATLPGANRTRRAPKLPVSKGRGGTGFSRRRSSSKTTINHGEIQKWAESRGGKPAAVRTGRDRGAKGRAGVLRIDFPGYSGGRTLQPISWEEWFQTFEKQNLALLYQEKTASGKPSRFNKLISRD